MAVSGLVARRSRAVSEARADLAARPISRKTKIGHASMTRSGAVDGRRRAEEVKRVRGRKGAAATCVPSSPSGGQDAKQLDSSDNYTIGKVAALRKRGTERIPVLIPPAKFCKKCDFRIPHIRKSSMREGTHVARRE